MGTCDIQSRLMAADAETRAGRPIAMNWKRIVAGGVAAGALIDVVEGGLSGALFGGQFRSELAARGLDLSVGPLGAVFFTAWGFVLGFVSVWLYAAVRPRLGPGPRTAVL